eukprot:12768419-Alexandrium_andersonii.AAC.1
MADPPCRQTCPEVHLALALLMCRARACPIPGVALALHAGGEGSGGLSAGTRGSASDGPPALDRHEGNVWAVVRRGRI